MTGGFHIVIEAIQQHILGAQLLQRLQVGAHLGQRTLATRRWSSGSDASVRRIRMRGHSAGTGLLSASAIWRRRGRPVFFSQPGRTRFGCQASPYRTARRMAASLAPPTQIGGWGVRTGRGAVCTSVKAT